MESARTALESCPADMADIWEEFAERAAIMRYDGGIPPHGQPITGGSDMSDFHPMTAEQAARWLGFSETTTRSFAQEGLIPARQVRGEWRFSRQELQDWLGDPRTFSEPENQPAERRLRLV